MYFHVRIEIGMLYEGLAADGAHVRPLARVRAQVSVTDGLVTITVTDDTNITTRISHIVNIVVITILLLLFITSY